MKKGTLKRFLVSAMAVAVLFAAAPSASSIAANAKSIAVKSVAANTEYSEMLPGGTSIEYKYTVPSNGYFYITMTPKYCTYNGETSTDTNWWIPYTLKSDNNYKQYESGSAVFYDGTYRSKNYCFSKGTVISFTTDSTSSSENNWYYSLEFHQEKPSNYEVESNADKKKATKVKKVNKNYSGVCNESDVDYWMFKAPSSGKYVIKAVDTDDSYSSFIASAFLGYKQISSANCGGNWGYKKVASLKLRKGQKVYIKISDSYSNPNYKLIVKKK